MYNKKKKPSKETLTKKQAMLIGKIGAMASPPMFPTPMSAANIAKFGRKIIKD